MLSFLLDDANFWFSCALGIVIALFILEMVGMFVTCFSKIDHK